MLCKIFQYGTKEVSSDIRQHPPVSLARLGSDKTIQPKPLPFPVDAGGREFASLYPNPPGDRTQPNAMLILTPHLDVGVGMGLLNVLDVFLEFFFPGVLSVGVGVLMLRPRPPQTPFQLAQVDPALLATDGLIEEFTEIVGHFAPIP